jgi:hypothetical protein
LHPALQIEEIVNGVPETRQQHLRLELRDLPKNDENATLILSIRTAVIVDDEGNLYQTSSAEFGLLKVEGVGQRGQRAAMNHDGVIKVIGITGNARHIRMRNYLARMTPATMPEPVKALLGTVPNRALLTELTAPQTPQSEKLNEYQASVVDLTNLRAAQVIVGPPGTGKSYTIIALIMQMVAELPSNNVIVLTSEKNGAIEAVAEHLRRVCMEGDRVTDLNMFEKVVAFGHATTIKTSTKALTMEEKIEVHPEVRLSGAASKEALSLYKRLLRKATGEVKDALRDIDLPAVVLLYFNNVPAPSHNDLRDLVTVLENHALGKLTAEQRESKEKPQPVSAKSKLEIRACIKLINDALTGNGNKKDPGLRDAAKAAVAKKKDAAQVKCAVLLRMKAQTRVLLSTIGSAHRVQTALSAGDASYGGDADIDDEPSDSDFTSGYCGCVTRDDLKIHYIIDEASTVPPFEITALGVLGEIKTLTIVGDPNQVKSRTNLMCGDRTAIAG